MPSNPMASHPIRILCVDDHTMIRKGLATVLEQESDMEVVANAADATEAIAKYRKHRPDITLMDLQLPGMSGFDAIKAIREEDPKAKIIVLTMYRGEADVARARSTGAAAYLVKNAPASELVETIRVVHAGGVAPTPAVIDRNPTGEPPLTAREEDVIQLLAKGLRNKQIAAALNISEDTVQSHVKSIFVKLGVHDRTEALVAAVRLGIVHLD
jgi:DNA-binding NarL/FixJ family response regulator